MPEFIKTAEVIGNIAEKIYHVGRFVVDRLQINAWSELPHGVAPPAVRPVRAHLEYYHTPDNITRGEE